MTSIELKNIGKNFDKSVLSEISFSLNENEFGAILGPSGSGKTTLLRIISGLESPEEGEIFIGGKCVFSKTTKIPPEKREVGFVFQDLALWPHMKVKEHIEFVLDSKLSEQKRDKQIKEILKIVDIEKHCEKYPHQLSGGEKQRLAIARTIAQNSKILLLDEPFSNLDPILKKELKKELISIKNKLKITIICVTQNPNEIFDMVDKIILIKEGKIVQQGKIKEILRKPKNDFVKEFLN